MANNIIFADGFDYYLTVLDKWDSNITNNNGSVLSSIASGVGRGGAGALSVPAATRQIGQNQTYNLTYKNIGTQTTLFVGFALNWNPATQASDQAILQFVDGSTIQLALVLSAAGILYFAKDHGSGAVWDHIGASTTVPFAANSFHYIEVQVTFSSTVGVANLKIDEAAVLTQSSLNTIVSANASCSRIAFGCYTPVADFSSTFAALFDDFYVDTLGFNGDVRINGQLPTGNGTVNNFTTTGAAWAALTVYTIGTTIIDSNSNMQRIVARTSDFKSGSSAPTWSTTTGVNTTDSHVTWVCLGAQSQFKFVNEPDPDGDSSYIKDSTLNDISRFTFPAIVATTIKTVIVWATARKDDGGFRAIQASVKSGATTATSGTDMALGGNYAQVPMFLPTDPNTSTAWTASGINGAEIGVKLTG